MYSLIRHTTKKHQLAINKHGDLEPFLIASGKLAQCNTANTRLATIYTKLGFYEIHLGEVSMILTFDCEEFRPHVHALWNVKTQTTEFEGYTDDCMKLIHQLNQYSCLATYIANMNPYPESGYEWVDLLQDISDNPLSETYILNYMGLKSNWKDGHAYFACSTDLTTERKGFCESIETSHRMDNGHSVGISTPRQDGDVTVLPSESDIIFEWLRDRPEDCTDVIQGKYHYLKLYRYINGRLRPISFLDIPSMHRYQFQILTQRQESIIENYGIAYFATHSTRRHEFNDIFFNRSIYSVATAVARIQHNPSFLSSYNTTIGID